MPERMETTSELRERVIRALATQLPGDADYWPRKADLALAALGLDDLDAFAERVLDILHPPWPSDGYARGKVRVRLRDALEAALTATGESEGSDG